MYVYSSVIEYFWVVLIFFKNQVLNLSIFYFSLNSINLFNLFSYWKNTQIIASIPRDQNQPLESMSHPSNIFLTLDHPLTLNGKPQTLMH